MVVENRFGDLGGACIIRVNGISLFENWLGSDGRTMRFSLSYVLSFSILTFTSGGQTYVSIVP